MTKEPQKKNQSSAQVLKTLQILMEGDYSMVELLKKLNEKEKEPIFNNSVVSKYINTCRQAGINIPKINNRYFVTYIPFGLELNDSESDLLQELENVAIEEFSTKAAGKFQNLVKKINRFASKKIVPVEKKSYSLVFETFARALNNKRKVKLMFKNRFQMNATPVTITKEKDKVYMHVFYKNRIRMIDAARLSGIDVSREPFTGYMEEQGVVFVLKDKLAKRYQLREDEKIVNQSESEGTIAINKKCRNTERLLSRLMRYDELCEIKSPDDVRKQMKAVITDTLKNYGIN